MNWWNIFWFIMGYHVENDAKLITMLASCIKMWACFKICCGVNSQSHRKWSNQVFFEFRQRWETMSSLWQNLRPFYYQGNWSANVTFSPTPPHIVFIAYDILILIILYSILLIWFLARIKKLHVSPKNCNCNILGCPILFKGDHNVYSDYNHKHVFINYLLILMSWEIFWGWHILKSLSQKIYGCPEMPRYSTG